MEINHIAKPLFSSADIYIHLRIYFLYIHVLYIYIDRYTYNRYRIYIHVYILGVFLEARLSR